MAVNLVFFIILSVFSCISFTESTLTPDYYAKTCPKFNDIMAEVIRAKQNSSPATAAAVLNTLFHDCMVNGCDGSVLIKSTPFNNSELDSDINRSLSGDAFDLITRAKVALELSCPGTVSCADILAVAARDLVAMTGGPKYDVVLGRKDGLVSRVEDVAGHIPRDNQSLDETIPIFTSQGFSIQEMVVLTGGLHTIGYARCSEFSSRIFGPNPDPDLNPKLAESLKKLCSNYTSDPTMVAFLDVLSPSKFDNNIFASMKKGLGILPSDNILYKDPRTKPFVEMYANDNTLFFDDFSKAIEKLSILGVKSDKEGEIRRRCDAFNV